MTFAITAGFEAGTDLISGSESISGTKTGADPEIVTSRPSGREEMSYSNSSSRPESKTMRTPSPRRAVLILDTAVPISCIGCMPWAFTPWMSMYIRSGRTSVLGRPAHL